MRALKLKIYQPQAHYRIPFTYQRRHTYPIPPYSTVKGLLCNVLGIKKGIEKIEEDDNDRDLIILNKLRKLKIAICGNFESKTSEYTWFRNLSKDSHISRFGYPENRKVSGHIEHPGGQMPVVQDILNDVRLYTYMFHREEDFLTEIKNSFENPVKRTSPLHLGRAEDFIVIEEINFIELSVKDIEGVFNNYFWIPERLYTNSETDFEFDKVQGLIYRLPTFYTVINGIRNFEYIIAKLNDGDIGGIKIFYDEEVKLPVFFFDLEKTEEVQ